ncbi:LysR family transcriptional regulator [Szabonella alba]|uniref:LysR family transcriptional regulator n=1 Tax=Szabonella alba TaxID=2804194 RepID=A0A8K0V618_9RHOB|nr:LysR family transcriptional regulator [Szabonella alba]MBL4916404.1 LysR family transcriptional regulator [Szabonella alba]
MARNLDLAALRSIVAVAEIGTVTRAAAVLNLTQSAVSMQIRRMEDRLGRVLFTRGGGRLVPTPEGEGLISYARRMLALNDEALARLAPDGAAGRVLRLGVPYDIVSPQMPGVLRRMAADWPGHRIDLVTSYSRQLQDRFAQGEFDLILTTETRPGPAAAILSRRALLWVAAQGMGGDPQGGAALRRPLPVAFKPDCAFRAPALAALEAAGIAWAAVPEGGSETVIETTVAAGLGLTVRMEGNVPAGCAALGPAHGLPPAGVTHVCLYQRQAGTGFAAALAQALAEAYADPG